MFWARRGAARACAAGDCAPGDPAGRAALGGGSGPRTPDTDCSSATAFLGLTLSAPSAWRASSPIWRVRHSSTSTIRRLAVGSSASPSRSMRWPLSAWRSSPAAWPTLRAAARHPRRRHRLRGGDARDCFRHGPGADGLYVMAALLFVGFGFLGLVIPSTRCSRWRRTARSPARPRR